MTPINPTSDGYANFMLAAEEAVRLSDWKHSSPMEMLKTGCTAAVAADRARMAALLRGRSEAMPGNNDLTRAARRALEYAADDVEKGFE